MIKNKSFVSGLNRKTNLLIFNSEKSKAKVFQTQDLAEKYLQDLYKNYSIFKAPAYYDYLFNIIILSEDDLIIKEILE